MMYTPFCTFKLRFSFVELNETDFVIRELNDNLGLRDLNLNFTPTLLLK